MSIAQDIGTDALAVAVAANIRSAIKSDPRNARDIARKTWPDETMQTAEQRLTRLRAPSRRLDLRRLGELETALGKRRGELLAVTL